MSNHRRYVCTGCWHEQKILVDAPDAVRTGCDTCESIRRWVAYGTNVMVAAAEARRDR